MIGRLLGKLVALPIKVVAVPFRILDRAVGIDDSVHECTPGTILRDGAKAVQRSIEEAIDE